MKKFLKYLKYTLLFVAIGLLVAGVWWSNIQAAGDKCRNVSIDILNADSLAFVTQGSIFTMLNATGLNPEGKKISRINTDEIENMLNRSEYIENAECVLLANNDINITVTQLIPVLRVFNGNESYYLNKNGKRMNASSRFHADVPIVSGNFSNPADALMVRPIIKHVSKDKALNDLITMYQVKDQYNIILVPCIYGHVINFGDTTNIENKFAKLKKFYREVMPMKGWVTYDTISLKWTHQIVANKRSKRKKLEILYNPDEEETAPSVESIMIPGLNDVASLNKESKATATTTLKKDTATGKPAVKEQKPKETVAKAFGKKKTN